MRQADAGRSSPRPTLPLLSTGAMWIADLLWEGLLAIVIDC